MTPEVQQTLIVSIFGAGGVGVLRELLKFWRDTHGVEEPTTQEEAATAQAITVAQKANPDGMVTGAVFQATIAALQRDFDEKMKAMEDKHDVQMRVMQEKVDSVSKLYSRIVRYAIKLRDDLAAHGLPVRDWPAGTDPDDDMFTI